MSDQKPDPKPTTAPPPTIITPPPINPAQPPRLDPSKIEVRTGRPPSRSPRNPGERDR